MTRRSYFFYWLCLINILISSPLLAQNTLVPFSLYTNWKQDFIAVDSIGFEKSSYLHEKVHWLINHTKSTPTNWKIDYWVKKDSTIGQDIYIRVAKNNSEKMYRGAQLLNYRHYFTPIYLAETTDQIILQHGCATDCSAITILPKTPMVSPTEYRNLVHIDTQKKWLICVTDSSYQFEYQLFQLKIVNLESNQSTLFTLPCICTNPYKPSCVLRVTYKKDYIELVTSLRKSMTALTATQITSFIDLE
ncbi:MAG: hypothetical protein ACRBFS_09730 [Aureispira sp.]